MALSRPFKVCLCADDYAMTPGISRGIIEALDAGALTATSVMTTSAGWPDAAPPLLAFRGRASIGLHLNLTSGAPLGTMPRLAPGDRLPGVQKLIGLSRSAKMPSDEVAEEIERQLEAFWRVFGRAPDHVDGHQHVHVLRPIRHLILKALRTRGWRSWLRDSGDNALRILKRGGPVTKALGVSLLSHDFRKDSETYDFATNIGFSGFSRFDPSQNYMTQFETFLRATGSRHLIMCHPGYVDEELRRLDPVVETREQELRFFTSPSMSDVLRAANATLANLTMIL